MVETVNPRELAFLTLRAAARGIREGRFTSEALARAYIARIRAFEPRVRAWAWFSEAHVLERAKAADRLLRHGSIGGPLHGVGVALKDIIDAAGLPTGMGSPIFDDHIADRSAACVEKLEAAGAFVLGKATTCEFATQFPPVTTNPWNAQFTPGGSSSGSAAAVAAGFAPVALGTQTRGSTIRPAVYCGIVGFKPTFGRVSRYGVLEASESLDHIGILARTADDAWLVTVALQGPDVRDPATLDGDARSADGAPIAERGVAPRLAAIRSPAWSKAGADQQALFESDCASLRKVGAHVEDVELPHAFVAADDATRVVQLAEIARNFADLYATQRERMSATFRALFERGAGIGAAQYEEARTVQASLRHELARVLEAYDGVVTPPATGEAPRSLADTGDASFCAIWTLCGVPCAAFATALGRQGMPMGLQVVTARGRDREALEIAAWCQARLPFHARPPIG